MTDPQARPPMSGMDRLPCGCQMGETLSAKNERVMLFEPCSPTCEMYLYVLEEGARQGKPHYEIDLR